MTNSLFDRNGSRKYLVACERRAFINQALKEDPLTSSFCITLAITGARISEVLALTPERIDSSNEAIVFETLKRRMKKAFRAVPVPRELCLALSTIERLPGRRLWPWCRTTAWCRAKSVLKKAGISSALCKPKALRHAFAIEAGQNGIPLNIVQRWLGHARMETTAIYLGAVGAQERELISRTWPHIDYRKL